MNLKEIFSELNSRVKNPIINAFFISWIIVNWRIPFAMLFFNAEDFKKSNVSNIIEYVPTTGNWVNFIFVPLLLAFAFQFVRLIASVFSTIINKWTVQSVRYFSKDSFISLSKYLRQRDVLDERQKSLEKLINSESETTIELAKIQNELNDVNQEKIKLNSDLLSIRNAIESQNSKNNIEQIVGEYEINANSFFAHFNLLDINGIVNVNIKEKTFDLVANNNYSRVFNFDFIGNILGSEYYIIKIIGYLDNSQGVFINSNNIIYIEKINNDIHISTSLLDFDVDGKHPNFIRKKV